MAPFHYFLPNMYGMRGLFPSGLMLYWKGIFSDTVMRRLTNKTS